MFWSSVLSSDLLPLDLLTRALPRPGQAPPTQVGHRQIEHRCEAHQVVLMIRVVSEQVQMVQSRGSRGLRLTGAPPTALSFSTSPVFTNCDDFPAEFSLVTTLKIQKLRPKVNLQNHSEPGSVWSGTVWPVCFLSSVRPTSTSFLWWRRSLICSCLGYASLRTKSISWPRPLVLVGGDESVLKMLDWTIIAGTPWCWLSLDSTLRWPSTVDCL